MSGDGHTVVFYGRDETSAVKDGGPLYKLDLTSEPFAPVKLLDDSEDTFGYSDAVFSQQEEGKEWLAWRAIEGGEATEGANYEVYAAPFRDGSLGEPVLISDPVSVAREQDPTFSPEGDSIVYGAQEYNEDAQPGNVQALWIAPIEEPDDRRLVSADDPQFWGVPAWSGR